jgi:hypothetical protein
MSFNHLGKSMETVDFGGEVDYSAYEWFKDPPPPRHAVCIFRKLSIVDPLTYSLSGLQHSTPVEPFMPQAGVIKQNEMFDFALKSAPNVLYARYKQYGQVSGSDALHYIS